MARRVLFELRSSTGQGLQKRVPLVDERIQPAVGHGLLASIHLCTASAVASGIASGHVIAMTTTIHVISGSSQSHALPSHVGHGPVITSRHPTSATTAPAR